MAQQLISSTVPWLLLKGYLGMMTGKGFKISMSLAGACGGGRLGYPRGVMWGWVGWLVEVKEVSTFGGDGGRTGDSTNVGYMSEMMPMMMDGKGRCIDKERSG